MGAAIALFAQHFPPRGCRYGRTSFGNHQIARHYREKLGPLCEVIRWVGQDKVGFFALRHLNERITAHDGAAIGDAECVDVVLQHLERVLVALNKGGVRGPARDCLDAERTGARKAIHDSRAREVVVAAEAVEDCLARHVGGGPGGVALG